MLHSGARKYLFVYRPKLLTVKVVLAFFVHTSFFSPFVIFTVFNDINLLECWLCIYHVRDAISPTLVTLPNASDRVCVGGGQGKLVGVRCRRKERVIYENDTFEIAPIWEV